MELKIEKITKDFKDKKAVDDVSITLTPGVWGLLGANGAGKTTLMKMVAGVIDMSSGRVSYNGEDTRKMGERYREIFGILPQDFGYPDHMSVVDYLEYVAALKGVPKSKVDRRIDSLLETLTLTDVKRKKISKLSGGMRRRVGIAQAMLNNPDILIMDEPTSGLDPGERIRFRNFISEFARNRIVLISTHIVSDVEYIATKTAIMKNGKIIDVGTSEELLREVEGKVWNCTVDSYSMRELEMKLRIINQRVEDNGRISIRYLSDGPQMEGSRMTRPSLEDLYLWLFPEEQKEEVK